MQVQGLWRGSWLAGVPRSSQMQRLRSRPKRQARSLGAQGSDCTLKLAVQARGVRLVLERQAQRWGQVVSEPGQTAA